MGMAYVNYLIAGRVAEDAKVVLSGMGGDEMTGGYVSRYDLVAREHDGTSWLRKFLGSLRGGTDRTEGSFDLYRAALNVPIPARELASAFTPDILREAPGFDPVDIIRETIAKAPAEHPWDRVMYVDATTYMHGLLVLEDKLSMVHSLETRVPLLDNEVVDFLLGVPWEFLTDGKTGKILFREAVRAWVPALVADKPKMGFGPPDASWYRGALKPFVERTLSSKIIAARGRFSNRIRCTQARRSFLRPR